MPRGCVRLPTTVLKTEKFVTECVIKFANAYKTSNNLKETMSEFLNCNIDQL